jgi:Ca-activated chloride channel family protein
MGPEGAMTARVRWRAGAGALLVAAVTAGWVARPSGQAPPVFAGGVEQVEVYATVVGPGGAPVAGLSVDAFAVYENGALRPIETFEAGRFPLTVALGVDRSWSMAGAPLLVARGAARAFLAALAPGDSAMVMAIDSRAEIVAPFEATRDAQLAAVDALDPWSTTALRDAIVAGLDHLADAPGRQALVVFSDGADRDSLASDADVAARVRRSRALIYPIAIGDARPPLLAELAVLSGGRSFRLPDAGNLGATLRAIVDELGTQYLIGYSPAAPADGHWRSIRVEARAADGTALRVRARDGYFAE